MNYQSFLFNITETEKIECIQTMEMAKAIDKESDYPNLTRAYELYQKAAKAHLPFAERRLGSMTINGEGTSADFYKGVAYYLMAAEDGDSYSENVLHFIWAEENNPIQFLYGAKNNNFNDSDITNDLIMNGNYTNTMDLNSDLVNVLLGKDKNKSW